MLCDVQLKFSHQPSLYEAKNSKPMSLRTDVRGMQSNVLQPMMV